MTIPIHLIEISTFEWSENKKSVTKPPFLEASSRHVALWISHVFYCFMISAVWDLHLDQYQAELMIYKAKRGQNYWFTGQNEKFTLPFVLYAKWIILTFRVDLWLQKVMWLRNGRYDFRKLGVKISARLQRKKSWSGAAESAVLLRAWQNLSRGASEVPPPRRPPPPPQCNICWVANTKLMIMF